MNDIWKEVGFFALIFVVVFVLWIITGGPARTSSQSGAFIKPITPGSSATIYGPDNLPKGQVATTTIIIPK